ncbi:MAG: aminopeptidase [Candidatus Nanoarchaeia archaeon]|nr:aminopeptidase [Candidatus Nanoarchaeia archaeon]
MQDLRIKKSAEILVNHSVKAKKGELIKINAGYSAAPLVLECARLILKNGAIPLVNTHIPGYEYTFMKNAPDKVLRALPKTTLFEAKNIDGVINIMTFENTKELSGIKPEKMAMHSKALQPLKNYTMKKKWVLFLYPTNGAAQDAKMSLSEYEDFVFGASNLDWTKEAKKMEKVRKLLQKSKEVHILGKETDLRFSVKGRKFVADDGTNNVPGGEVFTSPQEKTTEGHIFYDYPSLYNGRQVDEVRLEFKKGKVVKATASSDEDFLRKTLKTDKGASYLGEWGIGLNNGINKFTGQILFDEKINSSIHLALGQSYAECKGTNKSAIHWDMIKDLRKGGKIYLDSKLSFSNGRWKV